MNCQRINFQKSQGNIPTIHNTKQIKEIQHQKPAKHSGAEHIQQTIRNQSNQHRE